MAQFVPCAKDFKNIYMSLFLFYYNAMTLKIYLEINFIYSKHQERNHVVTLIVLKTLVRNLISV